MKKVEDFILSFALDSFLERDTMRLRASMIDKIAVNASQNTDYKVEFGKVISLAEARVSGQLYDFSVGQVKLKGKKFVRDFRLIDFAAGAMITDDIAQLFDDNMDALWVHSRIMHDFHAKDLMAAKKLKTSLMEFHFVAIEKYGDDIEAYPFVCTDYNGQASLLFSPYGPSQPIQRKISSDFWHVMLENPFNLFDYDGSADLDGVNVHYGYRSNKFYYEDM